MNCNFSNLPITVFLITMFLSLNLAWAGDQKQLTKTLTSADIQQRIQAVKDRQNLSEEVKNRVLASYQESEDNLRELQVQENLIASFKGSTKSFPLDIKKLQAQIAEMEELLKQRKPEKFTQVPLDELEQRLVIEKTRLSDLDAEIVKNETEIDELSRNPQLIREKISELKSRQSATLLAQQQLASKSLDSMLEREARDIQLESRINLLNTTLKKMDLENIADPLQLQLQKERMRLLNLQRERQMLLIGDLDSVLLDRRQQEIDKEQTELLQAEKEAEGKHPLIRAAMKDNMRCNRELQDVNKHLEQFQLKKNELDARNKQIEKDFQSAEQKINLAGLSPALGNLLREQRRNLPQRKQYEGLNDTIQTEIADASLAMFKLDEAKSQLMDINETLLSRMERELPKNIDAGDALRIRTELRMLLNDQKDLVGRLSLAYSQYAHLLGDVDFVLQQMLNNADKFGAYLDGRLLWVPSAPVISKAYLGNIVDSAHWFFSPSNWLRVAVDLGHGLQAYPILLALIAGLIALNWRFRSLLKANLQSLLTKSSSNQYLVTFSQNLNSLGYILALSLPVPLGMMWVAWVVSLNPGADNFSRAAASGFMAAALSLSVLQFLYRLYKPEGVAEILFHWHKRTVNLLFCQFKWLRFVVIPCLFVVGMANTNLFSEHSQSLGRTALILLLITMSYVLHRLTHPVEGIGKAFYLANSSWVGRLRYVWYLLAVLAPWVVIGFAVMGYYQSALQLENKLIFTLRLVFLTALFHALVLRWLTVTKRQLALQNARQKRKQADQASANIGAEGGFVQEENVLDISKINQQSDKLLTTMIAVILSVGTWMIWHDILPAFSIFERIELWQYRELVDGAETLRRVTLINILVSLFYMGLTFVFVSNFPALVDLLSAGKFALAAGSRYALIQLVRYLLVTIAFLAIANEMGGSWSQVQWLVAALSVGLGFGLQEIFANMVSGIILLFERPIRVGDTVTVGDVTGRVCRIQMRATHILDWDGKELVVPNKTIITDQLVNWTLTDTVTRVVLMVGVAYGSDVELVESVLKEAVASVDSILREPEPMVSFLSFGESSLDFRVTVHVKELGDRMPVTHQLHKKFYQALQYHNIEIPFPQRDIHIRSIAEGIIPA